MDDTSRPVIPAPSAEDQHRTSHGFSWYLVNLLLALAIYVFSIGPVAKLTFAYPSPVGVRAFSVLYAPLAWLSDQSAPFRHFLEWYATDVWKITAH